MVEIFSKFADYKCITKTNPIIYTKQQLSIQKQLKNTGISTILTLLLQKIKNEHNDRQYISLFTEYAEKHNTALEQIKLCLHHLRKQSVASYENIRVLMKLHEYDDDFIINYVNNELLAIIAGEFVRKYEKPVSFIGNFRKYVPVVFVSFVTVNNFELLDDFSDFFVLAYDEFERCDFEEICSIFVNFLRSDRSVTIFRNSLKYLLTNVANKDEYLNDFVMELVVKYFAFFKTDNFLIEILNMLQICNIDVFKKLLKVYLNDDVVNVINNSSPVLVYNFMVTTDKRYFLFFCNKIDISGFSSNLLVDIYMIMHFYNLDFEYTINENINDIRASFLKDKENFNFSPTFINGLSFTDKMCQISTEDIFKFIIDKKSFKFYEHNEYEKIFYKIEIKHFLHFIENNNLIETYQNDLKEISLEHHELRIDIFSVLEKLDGVYSYYIDLENIARYKFKEIALNMENLFHKVNDHKFYFDYMFKRTEILMQMKTFSSNKSFIEKIENMEDGELKKSLCKLYKIECIMHSSVCNEPVNKKVKLSGFTFKENIDQNIELARKKTDVLYYLDNNINIPVNYTLIEEDWKMYNRIISKITAYLIKLIRDEQNKLDVTEENLRNITKVLNLFSKPEMLGNILKDIYKFFLNNNIKSCFRIIELILNNLRFNIYTTHEIILKFVEKGGICLLTSFAERIFFDELLDFHARIDSIRYKNIFVNILKIKIEESQNNKKDYIMKLLKHNTFCLEGLKLSQIFMLNDEDCVLVVNNILIAENEVYILDAMKYLKESNFKFDNDYLYNILFKRAKLDNIACFILSIIEIKDEHIERLLDLFHLDPIKYIDFIPRINDHGGKLTDDMIKELLLILKNIYDDEMRNKIKIIVEQTHFNDNYSICQFILTDLEDVNYKSKMLLLNLLSRIYVNCVANFVDLVRVVGNEDNIECLILMLDILKNHKTKFYSRIQEWKEKDVLARMMFRIYPLDYVDKQFYKRICQKYKKCEEYDIIMKFYADIIEEYK